MKPADAPSAPVELSSVEDLAEELSKDEKGESRSGRRELMQVALAEVQAFVRERLGAADQWATEWLSFYLLQAEWPGFDALRARAATDAAIASELARHAELSGALEVLLAKHQNGAHPEVTADSDKRLVASWRLEWAYAWPELFRRWNTPLVATRKWLAGLPDRTLATHHEAEKRLEHALRGHLDHARHALGPLPTGAELARQHEDGALAVAINHSDYLARYDPKLAKKLRNDERTRMVTWCATPTGEPPWKRWEDGEFFAELLASVVWTKEVGPTIKKLSQLPSPVIPAPVGKVILAAGAQQQINITNGLVTIRGADVGSLAAVGFHSFRCGLIAIGAEAALMAASDKLRALVPLTTWLARKAHEQWLQGAKNYRFVTLNTGRNALLAELGVEVTEAEITLALEYLRSFSVSTWACIAGFKEEPRPPDRPNGRPTKRIIIEVGSPLAPFGLVDAFKEAEMKLPRGLGFYGPVFRSDWTPLVGNQRTAAQQRDFFTLGFGAMLTADREEYAEHGLHFDETRWRRSVANHGLYHRTHHSLADDVWTALTTIPTPIQQPLWGEESPRHPVLVQTSPGRWRLGPDFAAQDQAIRAAAKFSSNRRARRNKRGE